MDGIIVTVKQVPICHIDIPCFQLQHLNIALQLLTLVRGELSNWATLPVVIQFSHYCDYSHYCRHPPLFVKIIFITSVFDWHYGFLPSNIRLI